MFVFINYKMINEYLLKRWVCSSRSLLVWWEEMKRRSMRMCWIFPTNPRTSQFLRFTSARRMSRLILRFRCLETQLSAELPIGWRNIGVSNSSARPAANGMSNHSDLTVNSFSHPHLTRRRLDSCDQSATITINLHLFFVRGNLSHSSAYEWIQNARSNSIERSVWRCERAVSAFFLYTSQRKITFQGGTECLKQQARRLDTNGRPH